MSPLAVVGESGVESVAKATVRGVTLLPDVGRVGTLPTLVGWGCSRRRMAEGGRIAALAIPLRLLAVASAAAVSAASEAAVPGEAAMATFATMPGESRVPMRKAVAPPAVIEVVVIKVAMTPATVPAIDIHIRAVTVDVGAVTRRVPNGLRASG